jgi:trehalose 6-phosphate synthase
MALNRRLIVVSNRVPPNSAFENQGRGEASVGGLVTAVKAAMEQSGGLWFGWSGRSSRRRVTTGPTVKVFGRIQLATMDLSEEEVSLFYIGFANRTLWPLLHSFPMRVVIRHDSYRAYRRINQRFAQALLPFLRSDDLVWVQDFHLFHLGHELRRLGWQGKLGFFLHVPFPSADVFSILPWAGEVLEALLQYDLVGLHDQRYKRNLIDSLDVELGGESNGVDYSYGGKTARLGVFPIGIDPDAFKPSEYRNTHTLSDELSLANVPDRKLILGVDRLDYTKGIPHRLRIFERLLERHPNLGGKILYVQISSPSRTRVPEYVQEKDQVERLVGQINGRFSEAGWVPIRYLYRSYAQIELAGFYHDADVCLVTPLRDGMNLVAKEFVAAQSDDSPGVLVLSRFAGAASAMKDAVIVNPYDIEGTAEATYRALRMPVGERRRRNCSLQSVVERDSSQNWSDTFCAMLQSI